MFTFFLISTIVALLAFAFIRFCLEPMSRILYFALLVGAFMPCVSSAMVVIGLTFLIVSGFYDYDDLPLKDNKFNRWLFNKYDWR